PPAARVTDSTGYKTKIRELDSIPDSFCTAGRPPRCGQAAASSAGSGSLTLATLRSRASKATAGSRRLTASTCPDVAGDQSNTPTSRIRCSRLAVPVQASVAALEPGAPVLVQGRVRHYILDRSRTGTTRRYYVGLTSNVQQRIAWHIADTVRILPSTV